MPKNYALWTEIDSQPKDVNISDLLCVSEFKYANATISVYLAYDKMLYRVTIMDSMYEKWECSTAAI